MTDRLDEIQQRLDAAVNSTTYFATSRADIRWLKAIVDKLRDKLAKHEGHFGLNVSRQKGKIQLRCFDRTHSGRNILLFATTAAAQAATKEAKK